MDVFQTLELAIYLPLSFYSVTQGSSVLVYVFLDGVNVPSSPFQVQIIPSVPNARFATTRGSGLIGAVVGERASFTVQCQLLLARLFRCFLMPFETVSQVLATDTYGNALVSGGQASLVSVNLASGAALAFSVIDNDDGTYTVTYEPPEDVASFELMVQIDGVPVVGSPFSVSVPPVLRVHMALTVYVLFGQVTAYTNPTVPTALVIAAEVV